ncbi:hypothetical protein LguiA_002399 [Lonicera macranthoides]
MGMDVGHLRPPNKKALPNYDLIFLILSNDQIVKEMKWDRILTLGVDNHTFNHLSWLEALEKLVSKPEANQNTNIQNSQVALVEIKQSITRENALTSPIKLKSPNGILLEIICCNDLTPPNLSPSRSHSLSFSISQPISFKIQSRSSQSSERTHARFSPTVCHHCWRTPLFLTNATRHHTVTSTTMYAAELPPCYTIAANELKLVNHNSKVVLMMDDIE